MKTVILSSIIAILCAASPSHAAKDLQPYTCRFSTGARSAVEFTAPYSEQTPVSMVMDGYTLYVSNSSCPVVSLTHQASETASYWAGALLDDVEQEKRIYLSHSIKDLWANLDCKLADER